MSTTPRRSRTQRGGRGSRRVRRRQTAVAVNVTSVLLSVIVVAGLGLAWAKGGLQGDFKGDGDGTPVVVEVADGGSFADLAPTLVDEGVVAGRGALMSAAKRHPRSGELQPGFYRLQGRMSAESAVEALLNPDNRAGVVDLPTGVRFEDVRVVGDSRILAGIFSRVSRASCIGEGECTTVEELRAAAASSAPEQLGVPDWALAAVKRSGDDPRRLEGLITPGVHFFDPRDDARTILSSLVKESVKRYEDTGLEASASAVGLTPYQLVTAASLVQMEAPDGSFDKVARVILNRLHSEEPMRLQFDSTVNYDLEDQEVATTDADRGRVTRWNTYAMEGLPETPIASPSIAAIKAMEHPADGDWLYFVTVGTDGTTRFASTYEEHETLVEEARRNGVLDSAR